MPTNHYRDAIEAVGIRSAKKVVINRLNAVAAHSTDTKLQKLASATIHELDRTSTQTNITPAIEMRAAPSARELRAYCEKCIYSGKAT